MREKATPRDRFRRMDSSSDSRGSPPASFPDHHLGDNILPKTLRMIFSMMAGSSSSDAMPFRHRSGGTMGSIASAVPEQVVADPASGIAGPLFIFMTADIQPRKTADATTTGISSSGNLVQSFRRCFRSSLWIRSKTRMTFRWISRSRFALSAVPARESLSAVGTPSDGDDEPGDPSGPPVAEWRSIILWRDVGGNSSIRIIR